MVTLVERDPTEVTDTELIEQAVSDLVRIFVDRDELTEDVYQALKIILSKR